MEQVSHELVGVRRQLQRAGEERDSVGNQGSVLGLPICLLVYFSSVYFCFFLFPVWSRAIQISFVSIFIQHFVLILFLLSSAWFFSSLATTHAGQQHKQVALALQKQVQAVQRQLAEARHESVHHSCCLLVVVICVVCTNRPGFRRDCDACRGAKKAWR